jgi:hypothetical protein
MRILSIEALSEIIPPIMVGCRDREKLKARDLKPAQALSRCLISKHLF